SPWESPNARRSAAARSTERTALPSRTIDLLSLVAVWVTGATGWVTGSAVMLFDVAAGSPVQRRPEGFLEDRHNPVDRIAFGVGLADEPRLATVGLGHGATGEHAERDRVVELVVGLGPVAVF